MYLTTPKRCAYYLIGVLILPIYNGRARAASSPCRGMLISRRTLLKSPAAKPVNFWQLTGLIQLHPRASHHFMEDTINPKPYERKESLPGCFFFFFLDNDSANARHRGAGESPDNWARGWGGTITKVACLTMPQTRKNNKYWQQTK